MTASSSEVNIMGLKTHYLRAGEGGPPLVLLHGSALDSGRLTYGGSLERLARHYRVFVPDWPGYGGSEGPKRGVTTPFYIDFLREFVQALELSHFHLAGFSMGGGVALGYALQHPDRVDKLVLIDAYGLGGEVHVPLVPYLALRAPFGPSFVWAALRRSRRTLGLVLKTLVFRSARAVTEEVLDEVAEQLRVPDIERAFMGWLREELHLTRLSTNYLDRLPDLAPPTLLVHGSRDFVVPVSRAKRAAKRIPRATLKILPAGHWTPREARDAFDEVLLEFLGT